MKPMLSNQSHFTIIKKFATSLLLFLVSYTLTAQTVYTVDNRPQSGAQHPTVDSAISAASPGDIIYIQPSPTSYGSFAITKSLTIIGGGHNIDNFGGIRSTVGTIFIANNTTQDVSGTKITGLDINGSISAFSWGANAHNIHIINNRILNGGVGAYFNGTGTANWIIEGNFFNSSYTTNNVTVEYSTNWQIRNNVFHGQIAQLNHTCIITNNIFVQDDPSGTASIITNSDGVTSPIVTNNIIVITDPDITGIVDSSSSAPVTYTNCLTFKSGGGAALAPLPGSGNLDNTDPLFTSIPTSYINFYDNDFNLQAGSPAVGYGTDGSDLGVYGRNFPYDNNGRPISMPYPESMTILNTVVQPGQNLNVQFQAAQKN